MENTTPNVTSIFQRTVKKMDTLNATLIASVCASLASYITMRQAVPADVLSVFLIMLWPVGFGYSVASINGRRKLLEPSQMPIRNMVVISVAALTSAYLAYGVTAQERQGYAPLLKEYKLARLINN